MPPYAYTNPDTAEIASVKEGFLTSLKSETQGVSFGAVAGLSWTPTAMVTVKTVAKTLIEGSSACRAGN